MTEPSFQLEFLWLPSHEELPDVNKLFELKQSGTEFKPTGPLLNLKKHLSNFCDSPMFIKDFVPNTELTKEDTNNKSLCKFQKENAMFHQEYLYNIYCRIQIERDINTDYSRLVKLFSSFWKGCILGSELWLKHELMYMIDSSIETVDKYFILDKFELGNFVGLMNFVTHFDSGSTLQQHGFKVTQIKVKFLHDYKRLELYFVVGESHLKVKKRSAKSHRLYKLTIHYNAIHSVIVSRRDGFVAYFRMLQAPLMYAVEQDEEDESYISYQDLHSGTGWFRAVDLFKRCPSNMKKEFSMNTVLGLNFATENYDLLVQLVNHNKNMKVYFAPVNVVSSENSVPLFHINNFECFYAFQCLLSRSFEAADQLILRKEIDQFKSFVLEKSEENSEALSEALYQLYYSFNKGNVVILMHSLPILYDKFVNQIPLVTTQNKGNLINSENQQNNLLLIKRAICMPTHVMFLPPQPTLKSRALRSCNPDFSLRISIRDTNLETINMTLAHGPVANKKVQLREFFKEHFKTPLLKGIKVGKRCYNYVGSSTSQLRAHGLWFYACDNEGRTADKIRKEFGDIDKIKQVPKFMARMGQTFSQAMVNVTVPQEYTNVDCPEDDVKGGIVKYLTDNLDIEEDRPEKFLVELSVNEREESKEEVEQYTFSDGVGRISLEIAEEVYKKLDIEDKKPSAMQIRYAGCKGMLVIDPRLEGKKIFFRESMKKFSSKNDSLEILKLSEKRTAYLNRPLITILEQLGIEKEVFLKLQKKMIQNHIKSMFHETEAWCFLHRNSLLRLDFLKLHISGIRFTEDPLFRSMIYALFRKQIELLKTKANIEIPVDQGRVMFGVMDETFTLEYGQVFVQYSDWDTDEPRILEGTVVVTKNPCMHPGDVRKFEAVDVEALHHIRDCIVFPAKGHRPHPDEMAGSDLDGDEYHVMWLKDLIFSSDNKEPMHYAVRKDKTQDRKTPITIFRHGHRAPFNLYPNDNHPESFWKEGLGMLTQLGRLQHYAMGDHLLKRYKSFITTNPKEVEVLNADSDRCQFGAFAFIAGLYAPAEEYRFTDEIRWQPVISRHYVDKRNRYVLSRRKCPVASDDEHEMKMSREADDMREKYMPLYNFWSEHSGRNIKDWTRAADLAKTLACERDYNLTTPEWAVRYWSELQRQAGLSYYWNFRTKLIHRYRIGPLLKYMLENMEDKISGYTPEKRVYVYSTIPSSSSNGKDLSTVIIILILIFIYVLQ